MQKLEITLSNSHVDKDLKIKDGEIINLLQDVEGIHINNLKEFTNYLNNNNLGVFLLYRQVDILKKPKFAETVKLTTYPYNTNRISGYRHIYMYDENDELLVKTNSFGAFVNLETFRPARLPKEVNLWVKDGVMDPSVEQLPRKIDFNEDNLKLIDKIKVRRSHIDRYNHLNNAHYVSFAIDNMNGYEFNRIRAEYKISYRLNDIIYLYEDLTKDSKTFVYKDKDGNIYTVIEFSNFNE